MRLPAGTRLGPYEIVAPLGAGGMGEVYRARDTRLGRDVAVKVLSPDIASSPEALQRFEREARTISQLSHPHICALFDVGEAPNPQSPIPNPYLVMELLEGETLAQRLASAPLPLELTLRYATQIADALDKAHRAGIVHRDLKPANVMITKTGVKLLDFGLAKAVAPSSLTIAATAPPVAPITAHGAIAGTVQYMAPEQLAGRPADARSDIYALGAVIYEMATGRPAFGTAIVPLVPPALDRLVRTCMAADPDERWQSAHDVRLQLGAIAAGENAQGSATPAIASPPRWAGSLPWALAAAALAMAAWAWMRPAPQVTAVAQTVKMTLPPPPDGDFFLSYEASSLSVSPEGSRIAFVGRSGAEPRRIWVRALADLESHPLAGTDGASSMFWSPDGRSLAFFAAGKLRRIELRGGAPVAICDAREGAGLTGTWGADGQILFASVEGDAILSVAAGGGVAVPLLKPDQAVNATRLNFPFFLPDGRTFLYLERRSDGSGHLMLAGRGVAPREVRPIHSNVQYVAPGYLVFAADGALLAQRFDAAKGTVSGDPFSVAEHVGYFFTTSVANFASALGTLVFTGQDDEQRLFRFDRTGQSLGTIGEPGRYMSPRLSPDGHRLAFDRFKGGAYDIWEMDLARGSETRLTFGPSTEGATVWNPDGRSLFFRADQGGPPRVYRKDLVTGREVPAVAAGLTMQEPEDVSRDGRTLLFTQRAAGGFDLWQSPADGSGAPTAVLTTPFDEQSARFSPDGHAISFHSNVSGRYEVYVAPFPPTGQQFRVSTDGGGNARWSRDGRELFYLGGDGRLMAAPFRSGSSVTPGAPLPLFAMNPRWFDFDVDSTGRFVAIVTERRSTLQPLTVVLNWTAALDR